jgi:hypothetical protein
MKNEIDSSERKQMRLNTESFGSKFCKYLKLAGMVMINPSVIYYIIYLAMAILGTFYHPLFYSILLIEIINKYSTLRNFLRAITLPWKQLLLTFVLYIIVMYMFSIWGYLSFWKYYGYENSEDPIRPNGEMCQNMWMCFLTTYDMAFKFEAGVGTYFDSFNDAAYVSDRTRIGFDSAFNFVLIVIMINIVSGILIDTFGYLRDLDGEK